MLSNLHAAWEEESHEAHRLQINNMAEYIHYGRMFYEMYRLAEFSVKFLIVYFQQIHSNPEFGINVDPGGGGKVKSRGIRKYSEE